MELFQNKQTLSSNYDILNLTYSRSLFIKEEKAEKTYAELKEEYLTIKALLQVSGVNLSELDKIKE